MVRLANGTMVRAATVSKAAPNRKLLIVLPYFDGDKAESEELASLIADLERVKCRDADILLFGRADATEPSRDIRSKLEGKFERVLFERSRRKDAVGWPWGCNGMWYDMVTLFAQVQPWPSQYYAFIPLEPDAVPTRPGWIHEVAKAFKEADADGKACVGFVHNDPKPHLNGVAVYAIDLWGRVGSNKLAGGSPQIPYDIRHADSILPLSVDSPLFRFEFRRATIAADDLFAEHRGMAPAIWHGVKDGSARAAVRARHVTFSDKREIARQTVLTYYEPSDHTSAPESAAVLALWREGWRSRGWNPVVLSSRDAVKHPRFAEIVERVKKLPFIGHEQAHVNRFARWVALARVGGGLLVDYDLLPADFTPDDLTDEPFAINDLSTGKLCGLRLSRKEAATWIDAIVGYEPLPTDVVEETPCVTDAAIWRAATEIIGGAISYDASSGEETAANLVHFSLSAVNKAKPGSLRSTVMDSYLRAKV